jgi:ribulose-bisphosphate carboxylase large chain
MIEHIFIEEADFRPIRDDYIIGTYELHGKAPLKDLAWNIAVGQSIGNPNIRSRWESEELIIKHSCKVLLPFEEWDIRSGIVKIAFPLKNIDLYTDGISQLLCQLMGGQMDIDVIERCRLIDVEFPEQTVNSVFQGPKFGIEGVRNSLGVYDRPLLGGIIKPKVGMKPLQLLGMVKELVEGGVDFIKEDEIMSNPSRCPIWQRVPLIARYLCDKPVIYAVCINSDPSEIVERAHDVHRMNIDNADPEQPAKIGVHVNVWSGLGSYKAIRDLDLPIYLFFQKSGDKVFTHRKHNFGIEWKVICKLAALSGVDFIHAGMWGGYMHSSETELMEVFEILKTPMGTTIPSLSCGMHPGLVSAITKRMGIDYMANVGGAIHGHPNGTKSGAMAMRQALEGNVDAEEYKAAIKKWGKVE